jgi:hypothetical protein
MGFDALGKTALEETGRYNRKTTTISGTKFQHGAKHSDGSVSTTEDRRLLPQALWRYVSL